jgi:hypothetical protein
MPFPLGLRPGRTGTGSAASASMRKAVSRQLVVQCRLPNSDFRSVLRTVRLDTRRAA